MTDINLELELLKTAGDITDYELDCDIPEDFGSPGIRCYDQLTLKFPSGKQIKIATCCSGALENSSLWLAR